ncbi:MAG: tRNA guanosine(34) transglycosylase Tgt [Bacteroidia bacterium]|nr:tRNA guanosine(34) transglycosylase Tgt [Bacteroidia bacterium]
MSEFFTIIKKDERSAARTGLIRTDHGEIPTPVFMPVGTAGTVKAVHQRELKDDIAAKIILGNTYHLYLRPGTALLQKSGGLHRFIGWELPILTDSGGYQVFSLAQNRKLTEEGARFASHIDGSAHLFTPESVMKMQREIGADIVMAFDECTPYPSMASLAEHSMELTHRWLRRCMEAWKEGLPLYNYRQFLFPIVQGSVYPDLRKRSAEFVASCDLPGNAIGGLSVGEPAEIMYEMTALSCGILPENKPRYLMGVGTPANLLECIALGVDMFDCVMPTRNARHGLLFTGEGILNIKNEKWKEYTGVLDANGTTFVDKAYSRAYLRHLFAAEEILAMQIATIHNLGFYLHLMKEARTHIENGSFATWKNKMVPKLQARL